ncbi:MAG: hypothetical protein ACJ0K4_11285 [Verrucomicrobiales bacterium]|nr:MAG: hypothetical protein EVB09_01785 [Verrucomicrobiaceae bacterium]
MPCIVRERSPSMLVPVIRKVIGMSRKNGKLKHPMVRRFLQNGSRSVMIIMISLIRSSFAIVANNLKGFTYPVSP